MKRGECATAATREGRVALRRGLDGSLQPSESDVLGERGRVRHVVGRRRGLLDDEACPVRRVGCESSERALGVLG